jgi:hypothetical protein
VVFLFHWANVNPPPTGIAVLRARGAEEGRMGCLLALLLLLLLWLLLLRLFVVGRSGAAE